MERRLYLAVPIIQSLEMVFNPVSQALASLLSKRVGGAEKEKDLFELPALPKKVLWRCLFCHHQSISGGRLE